MRSIGTTLTALQKATTREPYLRVYFDNGGGTTYAYQTTDSPNRVKYIEQWEEPWAGALTLRLSNYDGHFTAKDLRGYMVSIGWGYYASLTGNYSNAADMLVLLQRDISYEGELVTEFYCVSRWAKIEQDYVMQGGKKLTGEVLGTFELGELVTGSPSGATGRVAAIASDYIVVTRVTDTFASGDTCTGGTSSATVSSISAPTDNYGALVYAAGDTTTEARIESLTGLTVDVDEDDDLSSMADTPKLEVEAGTSVRLVLRRMMLRTKCGLRYESDGHIHALYLDTTDSALYEFSYEHPFTLDLRERSLIIPNTVYVVSGVLDTNSAPEYIGTANDSDSVAKIGTVVAPVQVDPDAASQDDVDNRAAAWVAQRVAEAYQGQIVTQMECGLEVYDMVQTVDARLNVTAKGRIGRIERVFDPSEGVYEARITLGSLYSEPGAMDTGPDSRKNDLRDMTSDLDRKPPANRYMLPIELPPALLPISIDMTFTATDNDDVSWSSGTITFADKSTLAIDSGSLNLANSNPYYLYAVIGNSTLQNTQTFGDAVGGSRFLVAFLKKAPQTNQKALIVPAKGGLATFNEDVISANCITATEIYVSQLSAIAADIGLITTGEIRIGTGTLGSNFTGWRMWVDGSVGRIAGYSSDTLQWYTDTDGKLYAGGGLVYLDSDGISVKSTASYVCRDSDGLGKGALGYSETNSRMVLDSASGLGDLLIQAGDTEIQNMQTTLDTTLRSEDTVYQNTTGKLLMVTVSVNVTDGQYLIKIGAASPPTTIVANPYVAMDSGEMTGCSIPVTFIVPVDYYYAVYTQSGSPSIEDWTEWTIG